MAGGGGGRRGFISAMRCRPHGILVWEFVGRGYPIDGKKMTGRRSTVDERWSYG
jgi:hypothetical protein